VEVLDGMGKLLDTIGEGGFFGEASLLRSEPRNASIRAAAACDLFVLDKADFSKVLKDHPQFANTLLAAAANRS